jgi:HlyD family secretion protein
VVEIATARRTPLREVVEEDGRTRVHDRFVVASPITGNLVRIELEAGATVERGASIAEIKPPDPPMLDARTRREATARLRAATIREQLAIAAIDRARTARDAAAKEARRTRMLAERGALTESDRERGDLAEAMASSDLAQAELARDGAIAEVAAIRALLGRAGDASGTVVVVAPAAGRLLRVLRESAGPVTAGTPLVEIGDPSAIEVVVDVLSSDGARIPVGAPVTITAWGGDPLAGRVRLIEPSAFTRISALGVEEQRVNAIVDLDAPPRTLGDGFRVEVAIETWRGDAVVVVPAAAVFRHRGQWAVYAVENGRARLRSIEIGHRGASDVEVVSGVAEGTAIVIHPGDRVADDTRVRIRR